MAGETRILFWWLMFGGTHIVGSSVPVRTYLMERIGTLGFKGLYSLVSLATFVPLCVVYFRNRHAGAQLFVPVAGVDLVAHGLMLLALVVLAQGLITPNPMASSAEMSGVFPDRARGIQRLTRHPVNFGFALFGLAHLPVNPFGGDWMFFGGFVLYALLSAAHQDRRTLASRRPEVRSFQADTSLLPLGAILSGKQRLELGEYHRPALVVALLSFALLRAFHGNMFGGFGS